MDASSALAAGTVFAGLWAIVPIILLAITLFLLIIMIGLISNTYAIEKELIRLNDMIKEYIQKKEMRKEIRREELSKFDKNNNQK